MEYTDFTIRARDWENDQFKVEVTDSLVDRTREPEIVTFDREFFLHALRTLEEKHIDQKALISLGESLAALLLPPRVRDMLGRSLEKVGEKNGVRLRLVLDDPRIANLPWEYLFLPTTPSEHNADGFLALNPRYSIVRHESIALAPGALSSAALPLKMIVGLSSPKDATYLDVATEGNHIKEALADIKGIKASINDHLTSSKLEQLCRGAHIFHFAGHGTFGAAGATEITRGIELDFSEHSPETAGIGALVLEDSWGNKQPYSAEQLSLTLRAAGVKIVVMSACETGRRDDARIWNSIATALMRNGVPGVVAMQYQVHDKNAIVFAKRFYESLAVGLSLEEAMLAGRLAIFNRDLPDNHMAWGIPVLYLRSPDSKIFPDIKSDPALEENRRRLRVTIWQRTNALRGKMITFRNVQPTSGDEQYKGIQEANDIEGGGEMIGWDGGDL